MKADFEAYVKSSDANEAAGCSECAASRFGAARDEHTRRIICQAYVFLHSQKHVGRIGMYVTRRMAPLPGREFDLRD